MRKASLLLAVVFAAAFSATANVAVAADDPNQNTHNFMRDALNPYGATATPPQMQHMHGDHMHRHHMHHHHMHHHHAHMHHGHAHHMKHDKM